MECVTCAVENAADARFCVNCGAPLLHRCAHCQVELPPGARFCPACGQEVKPPAFPGSRDRQRSTPAFTAERKQVTVLFADISGFTALSGKLDAEEVHDLVNALWSRLDVIIAQHGGTIDKHIGDAVMALFGDKVAREEDPEQAVRAALAMQACLREFQIAKTQLPRRVEDDKPTLGRQLEAAPLESSLQAVSVAKKDKLKLGLQQPSLQMRLGIHTGLVLLGPVGTTRELTAMGDTVNLTSCLEQSAPIGGILISHDTYRQVRGVFDVQALPPLTVKGKTEPLQTYLVLCAKPRPLALRMRGVEGVETEMIGRESELKRLQAAFHSVMEERELQVFTIVGEAGIGKSCLLHEFQKWVELLPQDVRIFYGRATPEMAGLPFALIRDVFSFRFEIQESDPPAVAREKLERGLAGLLESSLQAVSPSAVPVPLTASDGERESQPANDRQSLNAELGKPAPGSSLCPSNGESAGARDFPEGVVTASDKLKPELQQAHFIGQLLGLDFSASPYLRGILHDAEQVRDRAFYYLTQFFSAASRATLTGDASVTQAALLMLEDVHWSDDGSLDLIDHLTRTCRGAPLMILCLARPSLFERRPAWGEGLPAHTGLNLEPLSRRESRLLVEAILRKASEIPQALRELVVGDAEGNPFYIEEIIKMLIDEKVIIPGADQWRIEPARLAVATIPPTLTGVLQARLDGLSPLERVVLQRASVVGRTFWDSAVEHLRTPDAVTDAAPSATTLTKREILEALQALRRRELILRREASAFAGAVEYTFKHELLRSVTYESVLRKLRRAYHAQVGAWLIGQSGERVTEFAGLVAAHFEHAARAVEAAEWYGRAAQQARMSYAPASAIEFFQKALALLPPLESSLQTVPSAEHAEARTPAGAEVRAGRIEWQEGLGEALGAQARFAEAVEAYTGLRALAQAAGDSVAEARAWNGLAFLHERRGDNHASVESAEQAERLARQAGDSPAARRERIRALYFKGWAFYRLGDAPAVLALGEQTLQLCTASGDRRDMAMSFKLHGVAHLQLGHFVEADRYFKQGLALCQELGDRRNAAAMWSNLGESARLRGDARAATDLYQTALALAREIGHRDSEIIYLSNLSGARLGLRQYQQAEADLREVIALADTLKSCVLAETYCFLSEACLGQGKFDEAINAAQRALTLARDSENYLDVGGAWRALGQVAATKRSQGAGTIADQPSSDPRACFDESLRVFKQINAEGDQARTLRAWAEYETRRGHLEEGRRMWEEARGIFLRLGMAAEVERMESVRPAPLESRR